MFNRFLKKKVEELNNDEVNENVNSDSDVNTGLLSLALEDEALMKEIEEEENLRNASKKTLIQRLKSLNPKTIVKLTVCIISVILIIVLQIAKGIMADKTPELSTDKRWISDGGATSVSIFLKYQESVNSGSSTNSDKSVNDVLGVSPTSINSLRYSYVSKLTEVLGESKKSEELVKVEEIPSVDSKDGEDSDTIDEPMGVLLTNEGLSGPYTYAYSARGKVSVASGIDDNHIISDANAYGVGGDFFIFHPLKLLSGSYFDDSDILDDGVILDSNSAFRLFGSSDIVGQMVTIGGVAHFVRGVYEPDDSHLSRLAGSDGGFIFMHYSSLLANGSIGAIDCVEFVSEEPYKGYMKTFFNDQTNTSFSEGEFTVVQNSNRFGFESLFGNVISNWNSRAMHKDNIVFPYWENIIRVNENRAAVMLIIQFALFILIVFLMATGFNNLLKNCDFEKLKKQISDKLYDIEIKNKNKVNSWKYF